MQSLIIHQLSKDLQRLYKDIESFKEEENLWKTMGDVSNSPGNLALHLVGNLNHFVGHVIGKTDYVRNRTFEFEAKAIPKSEILASIQNTIPIITTAINGLTDMELKQEFPIQIFSDEILTTEAMLLHLTNHLNYHLGQINYSRRINQF